MQIAGKCTDPSPDQQLLIQEHKVCNFFAPRSSHLCPQVKPAGTTQIPIPRRDFMKKLFSSLTLACVLAVSMAAFAQDQMKQDDMKKDDAMQHDTMKKDQKKPKTKKAKKDQMKKDSMNQDNMKHDDMKKDDMKKDDMKNN
jgi:pentapeptide MXKDX repeat protein